MFGHPSDFEPKEPLLASNNHNSKPEMMFFAKFWKTHPRIEAGLSTLLARNVNYYIYSDQLS